MHYVTDKAMKGVSQMPLRKHVMFNKPQEYTITDNALKAIPQRQPMPVGDQEICVSIL